MSGRVEVRHKTERWSIMRGRRDLGDREMASRVECSCGWFCSGSDAFVEQREAAHLEAHESER